MTSGAIRDYLVTTRAARDRTLGRASLSHPLDAEHLMGMPQATTRWTAEMVRALPDDGNRYEVVDGELLVTPTPRLLHQRAIGHLQVRMWTWIRQNGIGELLASPADISTRDDVLVQPDLFVVPADLSARAREWPDVTHLLLAVEVLSPSTARADRQVKRRLYRELADEYWIVDLDARLIERWRPDDQRPEILVERLTWRPRKDESAFELDLDDYFREVFGPAGQQNSPGKPDGP